MALLDRPFGPVSRGAAVPPVALNTQATSAGQQNPVLPLLQSIVSTAETQILSGPLPLVPLNCAVPPATQLEQTPFDVSASGYITTTASGTITLSLYSGISTTIGSNTLLKASSAVTQNTATSPYWVRGKLIYDSVSGTLTGTVEFYINKVLVASATLTNFPTGINNLSPTGAAVVQFSLTITSSGAASGTPTTINVQKFSCG